MSQSPRRLFLRQKKTAVQITLTATQVNVCVAETTMQKKVNFHVAETATSIFDIKFIPDPFQACTGQKQNLYDIRTSNYKTAMNKLA